jgi:hypothetical protein
MTDTRLLIIVGLLAALVVFTLLIKVFRTRTLDGGGQDTKAGMRPYGIVTLSNRIRVNLATRRIHPAADTIFQFLIASPRNCRSVFREMR